MRAHRVEAGVIINTVEVESLSFKNWTLIDADKHGGGIGDAWDGQAVVPASRKPAAQIKPLDEIIKDALIAKGIFKSEDFKTKE